MQHILVDGNIAVIEMESEAVAKNGEPFNNAYCWVVTCANWQICKVRAYVDSASVAKLLSLS
jgi:ketosteroid isomerase-like protein